GEEMAALRHAQQAESAAECQPRRHAEAPAAARSGGEAESDEGEAERGLAGDEGAIVAALVGDAERRGVELVAAELAELGGPRPAPVLLEHPVDEECRPEEKDREKIDDRVTLEAPEPAPEDDAPDEGEEEKDADADGSTPRREAQARDERVVPGGKP